MRQKTIVLTAKTFSRSWYEWIRLVVPTKNFRLNRRNAPTYGLELDLDHLRSNVYSLGSGVISESKADFARLAANELIELNQILLQVEDCDIDEEEKDKFRKYISATQLLLLEIQNSSQ